MITFDYTCTDCKLAFTYIQKTYKVTSSPRICPNCGAKKPTRMISRVRTKSHYGPQHPRHRRGLSRNKLPDNNPVYTPEDVSKKIKEME